MRSPNNHLDNNGSPARYDSRNAGSISGPHRTFYTVLPFAFTCCLQFVHTATTVLTIPVRRLPIRRFCHVRLMIPHHLVFARFVDAAARTSCLHMITNTRFVCFLRTTHRSVLFLVYVQPYADRSARRMGWF